MPDASCRTPSAGPGSRGVNAWRFGTPEAAAGLLRVIVLVSVAATLLFPVRGAAQAPVMDPPRGSIAGVAWDGYGAPLGGIAVVLETEGRFNFIDLLPGRYVVRADALGFESGLQRVFVPFNGPRTQSAALMLSVGQLADEPALVGEVVNPDGTVARQPVRVHERRRSASPGASDARTVRCGARERALRDPQPATRVRLPPASLPCAVSWGRRRPDRRRCSTPTSSRAVRRQSPRPDRSG
jgi:hypothetical protein